MLSGFYLGTKFTIGACWILARGNPQWRCDAKKTQKSADSLLATSAKYGFAQWMSFGTMFMSWSRVQKGGGEMEIEKLRQGVIDWHSYGNELGFPAFRGVLIDAYRKAGIVEKGLGVVDEAMGKVDPTEERMEEARLHWMKGELLLIQSDPDEQFAEVCFQQAIEIARRQSAKYKELQATVRLSRLWQAQGRNKEARSLLSEIYGWFTEGFDTEDMIKAKVLLDELS